MANTVIRVKKSGISGNVPGSLALGELAINYTDGLLYFANATGITSFSANASIIANAAFAQANAAYNQANTGGSSTDSFARNQANLAYNQANASFNVANTSLANTGSLITVNGASQIFISNTLSSIFTPALNALNVAGGIYATQISATEFYATNKNGQASFIINGPASEYGIIGNYATGQPSSQTFALGTSTSLPSVGGGQIALTWSNTGLIQIANTLNVGSVTVANTTASTSNTTGAVVISGGLGVAGNVYANGIYTSGLFYAANGNPISTGGGGTSLAYTAATTPPASGNNKGDQWYNTTTNVLYEWATDGTSYFWIDTSSPTVSNTSNIAINITGNINVGIVFANTVIANVNSTIIYSNTISVTGNVNANIIFANTVTANHIGNGSQLTGLTASQISGLYSNTNLSSYLSSTNIATSAITNTGNLITGNLTVTGSANFVTNSNSALAMTINNLAETVNLQTTVGQTLVNFYVAQQSIMLNTTPATANMTLNITGHPSGATLNTLLGVGQSITVAYGFTNGATTGYYISQLQIDGTNITPKYTGGNSQTGGDPSAVDMYTWTIIKTASTPTYNVFASNTKYA